MAYFKKTCSIGLSHSLFEFTASGYCVQYEKLDQFCPKQKFATQGRQIFSHHNSVSIQDIYVNITVGMANIRLYQTSKPDNNFNVTKLFNPNQNIL